MRSAAPVSSISVVLEGLKSTVFQLRQDNAQLEKRAFSLVLPARTLDIIAGSELQARVLVRLFRLLTRKAEATDVRADKQTQCVPAPSAPPPCPRAFAPPSRLMRAADT